MDRRFVVVIVGDSIEEAVQSAKENIRYKHVYRYNLENDEPIIDGILIYTDAKKDEMPKKLINSTGELRQEFLLSLCELIGGDIDRIGEAYPELFDELKKFILDFT